MGKGQVLDIAIEKQRKELEQCEERIERGLDDAYSALKSIFDNKLYKAEYKSFKDYCERRWGYSKSRAHQLIDHSRIVEKLKADGVEIIPTSEAQTRALVKLRRSSKSDEDFLEKAETAWRIAVDTAPRKLDVPQVSGEHVESAMSQFGIHGRKSKPKEDAAVTELRNILTKLCHCEAVQSSGGHEFVQKYGDSAFPNDFFSAFDWLQECAESISSG